VRIDAGVPKRHLHTGDDKMTTDDAAVSAPLWLAIERQIQNLEASAFDAGAKEATVHSIAEALDEAGYNVSRHGGHLMQLRRAVDARIDVGSPLLGDFNRAIESLTLDDVSDTYKTTVRLVGDLGSTWSNLQDVDIRSDIQEIVDGAKLDLQVEKAKEMADDKGARYLLEEAVPENDIIERLAISREILDEVKKAVAAEAAEAKRIGKLLEAVAEASDVDKAKHLISNDVADADILEVAGLDQGAIDSARQAMEEELREKERLAAEAEAAKKAAARVRPSIRSRPTRCSSTSRRFARSWSSPRRRPRSGRCASRATSRRVWWTSRSATPTSSTSSRSRPRAELRSDRRRAVRSGYMPSMIAFKVGLGRIARSTFSVSGR
jgi:hypothetical protein